MARLVILFRPVEVETPPLDPFKMAGSVVDEDDEDDEDVDDVDDVDEDRFE